MSQRRRSGVIGPSDTLVNAFAEAQTDDTRLTQRRLSHPTQRILSKSKRTHSIPLRCPPSMHPNLTDFGPVTLQTFLQDELKKHRDEQEKRRTDPEHRARYHQRQEALGLVNAPGSLRLHGRGAKARYTVDLSKRQARAKDVGGTCHAESSSRSCNAETGNTAVAQRNHSNETAKQGSSHRKARVKATDLRVAVSNNSNFPHLEHPRSAPLPHNPAREAPNAFSLSPLAPVFIPRSLPTAMNLSDVDSPDALELGHPAQDIDRSLYSTPSRIPLLTRHRASSFERYADSSRREQRQHKAKGKASHNGDGDASIAPMSTDRPRKSVTPFVADTDIAPRVDDMPEVPLLTENSSSSNSSIQPQTPRRWNSVAEYIADEEDTSNCWDADLDPTCNTTGIFPTTMRPSKRSNTPDPAYRPSLEGARDQFDDLDDSSCARVFDSEDEDDSVADIRLQNLREQQQAILNSLELSDASNPETRFVNSHTDMLNFEYSDVVPEQLPKNFKQADMNRQKIWETHGLDKTGQFRKSIDNACAALFPYRALQAEGENWLQAPNAYGEYPRRWDLCEPPLSDHSPPVCQASSTPRQTLPAEIWEEGVLDYLSSSEVRNLRLVCKGMAEDLAPYVFRSVVTNFKPNMFDVKNENVSRQQRRALFRSTMLEKYGPEINRFGISFEYDEPAMSRARSKLTAKTIHSWYGEYTWPVGDYPYFKQLKDTDELLDDDNRVLSEALSHLRNCSELALSVDSGYGWIQGSDMSDLSVYRTRMDNGSKIFGKTFPAEDRWHGFGLREYFKWAQQNTINTVRRSLSTEPTSIDEGNLLSPSLHVREYDTFLEERQNDRERDPHTGGSVDDIDEVTLDTFEDPLNGRAMEIVYRLISQRLLPPTPVGASHAQNTQLLDLAIPQYAVGAAGVPLAAEMRRQLMRAWRAIGSSSGNRSPEGSRTATSALAHSQTSAPPIMSQLKWPLIFNAFNIAADCRGNTSLIQNKVASPASHPLSPAHLTEPQAQWIMETLWIQRSFLAAYIDAVRVNTKILRHVHSLTLAKVSSGLLPLLATDNLWMSLSGLRKVKILVKPDWRREHTPGLKFSQTDTSIEPYEASVKFAQFLKTHISKLENLSNLTIGYCSGGEQQTGLFGRNQHILPAPITENPRGWLTPHEELPDPETMVTFNHIRVLTFQNCWFSPYMLERFMHRSRDSSLRHLVFDSVSMTGENSTRTDGPLQTVAHNLKCTYKPAEWLQELIPQSACWARAIDNITPGQTFLDRKYNADMIDEEETPRPGKEFRGNIERISFRSCGYVKISGIPSTSLNQNNVVVQNILWNNVDDSLRTRIAGFRTSNLNNVPCSEAVSDNAIDTAQPEQTPVLAAFAAFANGPDAANRPRRPSSLRSNSNTPVAEGNYFRPVMQAPRVGPDSSLSETTMKPYLLGSLTQCIHPVEKRILEQAWGMKLGWGSCMERWEAVEDGWLEGGTGRFSGEVWRDGSELEKRKRGVSFERLPEMNRFT